MTAAVLRPGPRTWAPEAGEPVAVAAPRPLAVLHGQLGYGGSERQLVLFLSACDREVWEPHVYAASHLGGTADELVARGIPVTLLEGSPLAKLRTFRRLVRGQRAQAMVSWCAWTNVFSWALLGSDVPRLGSFRGAGFTDLPVRFRALWSWASRSRLSTIVCNSPETAEVLRRRVRRSQRVVFVPNAVEPLVDPDGARRAWRRRLGVHDDELLIMGIGRLEPVKGFDRFIDAVALCSAGRPVRAVILGPDYGGIAAQLQARIDDTGMEPGTVRWLGPADDAREAVCAADVYLLSSLREGMPNVVLEAMAAGVPCVTTPVSGVTSILTPGLEGLLAAHDAHGLADALAVLVDDPGLRRRMGERARSRILERHTPVAVYGPVWSRLEAEVTARRARSEARLARRLRAMDVALGAVAAVAALPVAAVVALCVRMSGRGPVLHSSLRMGRGGRPFRLLKFRTMSVGADAVGPGITVAGDPRVTRAGRWLRRSKLDELPQLINVLRGDMSLVGPRPEDPRYVDLSDPLQRVALTVRPGLTSPASLRFRHEAELLIGPGWEQVYRDRLLPAKLAIDCDYLAQASLRSHLRVLALTALALAPRRRRAPAPPSPLPDAH